MTVENEAFIDIEQALHNKVDLLWRKQWREIEKTLNRLANEGKWEEAFAIARNISLEDVVEETKVMARTMAEAALFLGASRVGPPEEASFFGAPEETLLDIGVEQWSIVLLKNATIALQKQAEIALAALEREIAETELNRIIKVDTSLGKVGRQGTQFSRAAAALMISRMSTAGFMIEASARGIKQYRVSEVLDGVTCPICRAMHNRVFPVADGLALSTSIMQATDPESLRAITPFPSQSAANVKKVRAMDSSALVKAGMNLPPYHPNCRGITTIENVSSGASLSGLGIIVSPIAPGSALQSSADLTPDELAARMFGEFDDLDLKLLSTVLGATAGSLIFDTGDADDDDGTR